MSFARLALGTILLQAISPSAQPALRRAQTGGSQRSSAIALRKRLHVNTLITGSGEMEAEFGGAFSVDGGFTLPSTIKYTPEGTHPSWAAPNSAPASIRYPAWCSSMTASRSSAIA